MRFQSSFPLILSLPLLAIAAPNGSDDSATSTETATETRTITHTQLRATLTSTYPALSYFPILAATDSVPGDIPNPTLAGSGDATQILVALPSTSSTIKAQSSSVTVAATGTAPGTATTPLVLASATNLAKASPPIAPYTGAAAAGMRGWGVGMVLVGAAVGFAAGLL